MAVIATSASAATSRWYSKLDAELNHRAAGAPATQITSVIVRFANAQIPAELKKYARPGSLDLIGGFVLDVPNSVLKTLATNASLDFASVNGTLHAFNFRTGIQSGAFFARRMVGVTGAGVGVAILDSGITQSDEFDAWQGLGRAPGATRVTDFIDFTDAPCKLKGGVCDTNGHGTHVAGTIGGNGFNSFGERSSPRVPAWTMVNSSFR